ncbi:MAG: NADP-dependent phosphogluconate dehydrogenase, partial [Eudoraea sp.]|nr:NADP-dependent phosphogluconate dehydrogenase [Eudoraea sp.]
GIEYGLMQLTAEFYDLLQKSGQLNNAELLKVYSEWNKGRLQSFLVEISAQIFEKEDPFGQGMLVDKILDKAKQKGTGKWTSQNAMDIGIPIPTIDIAVSMREISALKPERVLAAKKYDQDTIDLPEKQKLLTNAEKALYFAFIITYAQGMHQLKAASDEYGYELSLAEIAKIWRAGCIIRAALLEDIANAFEEDKELINLLLSPAFEEKIKDTLAAARELVAFAANNGIPMPGLFNSLSYFDAYTSARLPLNLIQAQRDYFGSHTYERIDKEGIFHTDWS